MCKFFVDIPTFTDTFDTSNRLSNSGSNVPMGLSVQQVVATLPSPLTLPIHDCASCGDPEPASDSYSTCNFCGNHFCEGCMCDCVPERQPVDLVLAGAQEVTGHVMTPELVRSRHLVVAITDNLCSLVHVSGDVDRLFTAAPEIDSIFYKQVDPSISKAQGAREINVIETFEPYHGAHMVNWTVDIIPYYVAHELYVASVFSSSSNLPPLYSA